MYGSRPYYVHSYGYAYMLLYVTVTHDLSFLYPTELWHKGQKL